MNNNYQIIAKKLVLAEKQVENTILLLNEGCTIPFIARYRKERTGSLDEVQIAAISEQYAKMQELTKRKDTICKTIEEQGKLTADLKRKIFICLSSLNEEQRHRLRVKTDLNHWPQFCCYNANNSPKLLPNAL